MIPWCRRGLLVVVAVTLLVSPNALAQEAEGEPAEVVEPVGEAPVVDPPSEPDENAVPQPDATATAPVPNPAPPVNPTPTATPRPIAGTPPTTAPQRPMPAGPRETPPTTVPHSQPQQPQPPAQASTPPQAPESNGSAKVLGRPFPSPITPPSPPEPPGVHITVVPPSESPVKTNRLRGDGGAQADRGGAEPPAANPTPAN